MFKHRIRPGAASRYPIMMPRLPRCGYSSHNRGYLQYDTLRGPVGAVSLLLLEIPHRVTLHPDLNFCSWQRVAGFKRVRNAHSMCTCMCTHVYAYVCVHACGRECVYICICLHLRVVCAYAYMSRCLYVYVCMHMYMYTYIYTYMYLHMDMDIAMSLYIYMFAYRFIHTHTHPRALNPQRSP